jgi:hypothetical protein
MDWQDQAEFLNRWPELHSLLAAYIAIDDEVESAVQAFKRENPQHIVQRALAQLNELLDKHQAWCLAIKLAGEETDNHQAWLLAIKDWLEKET